MAIHYCEFGPPPSEADNANHAPTSDDPWWQESTLVTWGDPRRGFGGELRWGMHANQRKASLYAWIVWDGRTIYRRIIADQPLPAGDLTSSTIGPASITTLVPLMEFAIALDVPECQLRLNWRNFQHPVALTLAFGGSKLASGHNEMMGECTGEITVDGVTHAVGGGGFWDHSWGVRRNHMPASRSYFCVVDETFFLCAMPVLGFDGDKGMLGYVYADGKLGRLGSDSRLGYTLGEDWFTVKSCDSVFYDEFDRGFRITGRTIGTSSTQPMGHGKLVSHAVAEFEVGGRMGRGILETSHPKRMRPDQIAELGLAPESWWLNELRE